MTLPAFVIQHGKMKDAGGRMLLLGNSGWTTFRPQVLSFLTRAEGEAWIIEARKATPKLFVDATPSVTEVKDTTAPDGFGAIAADFDPYRESA